MAVMVLIISSFFRMRSFRQGKASVVIKLCLPAFRAEVPEEEGICDKLNSFYQALAEAYREAFIKLPLSFEGRLSVSVGFLAVTDKHRNKYKRLLRKVKNPFIVERYIRSSPPLKFADERHIDVFDLERGILLK